MKFLLDNGLPRSAAELLRASGVEASHVGEVGLADASDASIMAWASREGAVAVTLDSDFHTRLALTGASSPSVVRIRMEGLKGAAVAMLLLKVSEAIGDELRRGAAVTVNAKRLRSRLLPLE